MFVNTVSYIMCMSLVSSNIGGFTKKATVAASSPSFLDSLLKRWAV